MLIGSSSVSTAQKVMHSSPRAWWAISRCRRNWVETYLEESVNSSTYTNLQNSSPTQLTPVTVDRHIDWAMLWLGYLTLEESRVCNVATLDNWSGRETVVCRRLKIESSTSWAELQSSLLASSHSAWIWSRSAQNEATTVQPLKFMHASWAAMDFSQQLQD